MNTPTSITAQSGITLVELMVSSLLGILLLYAAYRAFEVSERASHDVMTVAEMQISGLQGIFLMEQEINNAGNGLLSAAPLLSRCPDAPLVGAAVLSLRPLPAVIHKGKDDDATDELFVFYGTSPIHSTPLYVINTTPPDPHLFIQTPLGLSENGNLIIVSSATGNCHAYNTPPPPLVSVNQASGITHFPLPLQEPPHDKDILLDLGAAVRRHYYVKNETLYTQEWRLEDHQWKLKRTGDPVISNVVRFWAQYGIDTTGNNTVDQWVHATDKWSSDSLRTASLDQIRQIRALRIAFILRSEEPDKSLRDDYTTSVFQDCPVHASCSGGMAVHIAHDTTQPYGWRYRTYETTVPMNNAIWNFRHE